MSYYYASFDDNDSDNDKDIVNSSSSNWNKNNRPPLAKNAHKRPQPSSLKSVQASSSSNGQFNAKQRWIDPRFEPMLGKVDVR